MTDAPATTNLLPHNALSGVRVGISISDSADLSRLGLLKTHFELALGEVARCVLVSGGGLAYGGNLNPDGYTPYLVEQLHRYSRRDRPLRLCLGWSEHRALPLSAIANQKKALGLFGTLVCLDVDGAEIDPSVGRSEAPASVEPTAVAKSLTALRQYMTSYTQGRVLLGGRREGFLGDMPGVLEEATMAMSSKQAIFLAGGFGGVTLDIIGALGIDDTSWLPAAANAPPADARTAVGLKKLTLLRRSADWSGLNNGLTYEENARLARTYRPSEIAALISLGLGRRAQRPAQ